MRTTLSRRIGLICLCVCWACLTAEAVPLRAYDLLLVYNARDNDSRELAEYYAKVRRVPPDRLLGLDLKTEAEEIAADEFEHAVRRPILKRLGQEGLRDKVRCLVMFYGLPIRVGPQTLTPEEVKLREQFRGQFEQGVKELEAAVGELDPAATRPASRPKGGAADAESELRRLRQQYGKAVMASFERIKTHESTPEGQAEFKTLLAVMKKVEGPAGLLMQPNLKVQGSGTNADQQIENAKRGLAAQDQRIGQALAKEFGDPAREQARKLMLEYHGLAGWLFTLSNDLTTLRTDETTAAVDSELMLIWWDRYPKYRWIANTMNWRTVAEQAREHQPPRPPVMMVSRIDGPTAAIARGLIDKALVGEKAGPTGNVYIDARGMGVKKAGFGPYDEALRRLAKTIRTKTSLRVRLDNREALFRPGECPQTVLYCGWYSLRKYIDSFTFVPGAVGFHIASFEAISLKQPGEQGWCKGLLERGITATLGPVAEPYLQSFPPPDEFFGLLLTGKFTLGEVYAYTSPYCSWMQMLIGDPLYRPFAKSPMLRLEDAVPTELIPPEYRTATQPG